MDPKQLRQIIKEEVTSVVKEELEPIKQVQQEQSKKIDKISRVQQEHGKQLQEHGKLLQKHGKMLEEHGEQLDGITAELHVVHQLADATVDIVSARYEKNKREIDEIKDHVGLPKESYFGE